ncbi:MAG: hypothetical protein FH749_12825 [Firmicutes bacterium]|nr:hypothetical protein [Bacillota bacterium]
MLVTYVEGQRTGEYNWTLVAAGMAGTVFAYVIHLLQSKSRTPNIPEADERSQYLLLRFCSFALYFVLFISAAMLLGLYIMGIESVSTIALIFYMIILFIVLGVGGFIIRRL